MEVYFRFLEQQDAQETEIRGILASKGGWGLIDPLRHRDIRSGTNGEDRSAISLLDFRKIFRVVSPWKSGGPRARRPSVSEGVERRVMLVDRIYVYSSAHFKMARKGKLHETKPVSEAFIVDLATVIQVLDIILKQSLNARMRFLFDIHDVDGDGSLNNSELTSIMDSLLEMFDDDNVASAQTPDGTGDEEVYLKAVSSFLSSALKLGSNKGAQPIAERTSDLPRGARRPSIVEKRNPEESGDNVKLSFNEFLLAILSQTRFVEFFEKTWSLKTANSKVWIIGEL